MSSTHPARRGSREYYRQVFAVAERADLNSFISELSKVWNQYGRRSAVDVATELVCAIDYITPLPSSYRDITGCVRLNAFDGGMVRSPELALEQATVFAAEGAAERGTPVHEEFARASRIITDIQEHIDAWTPVLNNALRAAHTEHGRDPVRAALSRGPGLREKDWEIVRDGLFFLYTVAHVPMAAARELGTPLRPPMLEWIAQDQSVSPHMIMSDLLEGELSRECR